MTQQRRKILVGLTLLTVGFAAIVLSRVIWTVVLGITAAYVLFPLHKWLLNRGIPAYWSAMISALFVVVATLLLFSPIGVVLFLRRAETIDFLRDLPAELEVTVGETEVSLNLVTVQERITPELTDLALSIAAQVSILAAQFVVFAFVVFALLYYHERLDPLVYNSIPPEYHGVVDALHMRVRDVLFGHYVLVIIGGAVTYIAGVAVFSLLGYSLPLVFSLAAAILWILPFVSPAPLVLALGLYHLLVGEIFSAALIGLFGVLFLVAVPRVFVAEGRYRLGHPQSISPSVYFIGFVGGFLTIGLVGIVVGPIALALLGELLNLLSGERTPESTQ